MGSSKLITIPQAAKLLDVHVRTIYRYAKRGILQAKCEGRRVFVAEEDILTIKKGRRDALTSPVTRDVVTKLMAEVQTLKTQMATCMRILNVRYDAFSFTAPEYEMLYRSAEQLAAEGWSPHTEEMWAEYFVRFRVEDFEKTEKATGDKHPWRPFLKLATTMYVNPWNKELIELLGAGKNNIQQAAGVWCILKEESPRDFDILLERDTSPSRKLIRKMKKVEDSPTQELVNIRDKVI